MNKHIELVKKWLADKESVSQRELRVNYYDAADARVAAYAAYTAAADAYAAYTAAADASAAAAAAVAAEADRLVKRYEELTNDK
jgi:hypothetical protein